MVSKTTDPIRSLWIPTSLTKPQSFLGLRNIFWRFYPELFKISDPTEQKYQERTTIDIWILQRREKTFH